MNNSSPSVPRQNLAIRLLRVLRYNKVRSERAIELLAPEKRPLFHALPFLLHINHPQFPGFVDDPAVPHGLSNYSLRTTLQEALYLLFPEQRNLLEDMKRVWPKQRSIDALLLMGSVGTIAQSEKSDFDFWACVDAESLGPEGMKLLQIKLQRIEQWAWREYQLEVHFFLSDITRVQRNDFGEADGESAGSAQALFLKAEFYTTHIVVAGKAPFWWLMPDDIDEQGYQQQIHQLKLGTTPDPSWFMDLGHLQQLDAGELFGAAIWQIVKAMDSPFKSVLKMAKLEVFLHNIEHGQPLCNVLRSKVHNGAKAPGDLEHVDPYALMFDELINHYQHSEHKDIVQLLRMCLYIKCDTKLSTPADASENTFKRTIMSSYVAQWGWSKETVRRLDRIKYWDFHDKSRLSKQIHQFLIACYRRISTQLSEHEQQVSQQDMTVIGRKIEAFYAKKPNKVDYLRSVFDNELYSKRVTIKADVGASDDRLWHLYDGDQLQGKEHEIQRSKLLSHPDPIQLIAWAVWNKLMDPKTRVLLDYHTEPVNESELQTLTRHIHQIFPPVKVADLPREVLLEPSRIVNCLVVLNFESRRTSTDIKSVTVLYSTSWGELYITRGLDAVKALQFDLLEVSPRPGTYLYAPADGHKQRLYQGFANKTGLDFQTKL
ncbi:class I adenylate cyclase [Aestuariibacter halophilus]|uniref:Class I adenylate cyclase n=1 Tax=Fluctibacter halophilus TaxID=226011 RepID=A0ABS8GFX2_9ALTE|nr:class I adenylate cyclase [Aestuariibacter halophilus]MCC2618091.1 class I adenylate cyclase [Aestuariibacter halophilus]